MVKITNLKYQFIQSYIKNNFLIIKIINFIIFILNHIIIINKNIDLINIIYQTNSIQLEFIFIC